MLYVYLVLSAALILVLDNFVNIFGEPYSWWLCVVLLLGFTLTFAVIQLLILVICVATVNLKSDPDKNSKAFRKVVELSLSLLFTLVRVKVHTSGFDKLPENDRVMLVCNHTHEIDPAVIIKELPHLKLGFIAKKEAYDMYPFVAKAMHRLHCLPIDRENNREAAKTIVKASKYLKERQASIGIFPEGYANVDGNLQPLRNGAFKIAVKAEAPIVVCTLWGMCRIHKRLFIKHTDVYLDVVDVIYPEEFADGHTDAIGERVYNAMKKSLDCRKASIEEN